MSRLRGLAGMRGKLAGLSEARASPSAAAPFLHTGVK